MDHLHGAAALIFVFLEIYPSEDAPKQGWKVTLLRFLFALAA